MNRCFTKIACCFLVVFAHPSLFALDLYDQAGFVYDIKANGMLEAGSYSAYRYMYGLRINGSNYQGSIERVGNDGRTVYFTPFTEMDTGLVVSRQVYVPLRENFIRYMEVFQNPTVQTQKAKVEIFGTLGTDTPKILFDQHYYLMTDDGNGEVGGAPVLLHYHSQIGNSRAATHVLQGNTLSWTYPEISIAPGKTVRLVFFAAQTHQRSTARRMADVIFGNESLLYEGITADEQAQMVNFAPILPIVERDFSTAPTLTPGETRQGVGVELGANDTLSHARAGTLADAYRINLLAGDSVTLRMSAMFDSYLYIFDDVAGSRILAANNNIDLATTNAEIMFTAPRDGAFYVEATAYRREARGNYTLEVIDGVRNRAPIPAPLEYVYDAQVDPDKDPRTAPAGVAMVDFSRDPDDEIVQYCWNFGDDTPEHCTASNSLHHAFEQPGHYTVSVRLTDSHNLAVQHSTRISVLDPMTGVILPINSSTDGDLRTGDAYSRARQHSFTDRYTITSAVPGKPLQIDLASADFDTFIYLYDQFGQRLRADDNSGGGTQSRLLFVPQAWGNLLLEATSVDPNAIGNYHLQVQLLNEFPQILDVPLEMFPARDPLHTFFMLRLPENVDSEYLRWNFGDNTPEVLTDGAVSNHHYSAAGNYTVTVKGLLRDGRSIDKSARFTLNTLNAGLNAKFRNSPIFGDVPLKVFFKNEASSNLSGDILHYHWDFGDGSESTAQDPDHFYTRAGTYNVVLNVTSGLTGQHIATSGQVVVIDRNKPPVPVTGVARTRPQVLIAGFDPILVDMAESHLQVFAIVRPGNKPIQSVLLYQNPERMLAFHHAETYADGTQRYELILPYASGDLPAEIFGNLIGTKPLEYSIHAVEQDDDFHVFPQLEFGHYDRISAPSPSYYIVPRNHNGVRRKHPQVLAAGAAASIIDLSESTVEITALVRAGLNPIRTVTLKQNQTNFTLPMRFSHTMPNGDLWYTTAYTFPAGTLMNSVILDIFGTNPNEYVVEVVDYAGRSHRYPELRFGNYPPR